MVNLSEDEEFEVIRGMLNLARSGEYKRAKAYLGAVRRMFPELEDKDIHRLGSKVFKTYFISEGLQNE